MAVIIKGKSTHDSPTQAKSLKSLRAGEIVPVSKKEQVPPTNYLQKLAERAVKPNETSATINNGIIKPKYIEDKSVGYKKSGYVKDLLGEEI